MKRRKIYIGITVIWLIGMTFFKLGLDFEKILEPTYHYSVEKKSDYQVLLKPNAFYDTETLPADIVYAAQSIDNFDINLVYDFQANQKTNIDYTYCVTADLVSTAKEYDNENREIWNKTFYLVEEKTNQLTQTDMFQINENVKINYSDYNNLKHAYEKNYGMTVDCVLKVHLHIMYEIQLSDFDIENEKVEDDIELDIPIRNTITETEENYEKRIDKNIFSNIALYKIICYMMGSICVLMGSIFMIISIRKYHKTPEEQYARKINRILKNNRDLIVSIKQDLDITKFEWIYVKNFEDLVFVAEQNGKNILYYASNEESKFYIKIEQYVYIYVLHIDNFTRV